MAGSLKWFKYVDDRGRDFGVKLKESTVEGFYEWLYTDDSIGDVTPGWTSVTLDYVIPGNITPRYARFATADNSFSVKVPILEQSHLNELNDVNRSAGPGWAIRNPRYTPGATDPKYGEEFLTVYLRGIYGEVFNPVVSAFDTGLDDGDES